MAASNASQSRAALSATVSSTGWISVGELLITRKISLVAACCSSASASCLSASVFSFSASARRCSRSRTLPAASLVELRTTRRLAFTLTFLGFPRRSISFSLPPTAPDRQQARRVPPSEQVGVGGTANSLRSDGGLSEWVTIMGGDAAEALGLRVGWLRLGCVWCYVLPRSAHRPSLS